ncbi:MAG: 3-hydroxy-3-methylglutaryl-CoA lyase [Lachnospiraceae bacterium]|jgi:4-hydroxy 2-oxovalerate aldolase|nr:3-hydroxy-3-methylglutaryl-CoA lyase [Lachnospiraceae bacterium]
MLLLDCTLRDGGYVNDWEFGYDNIINIYERLISARIDIVEVGFIDARRPYDVNRSIFPDTASVGKTFERLGRGSSIIVGMIDYGTCPIENIEEQKDSFLDGIRVIFKKEKMHKAIAFCRQVKAKGYKVFAQAVSITSYDDDTFKELLGLINGLEPYAFSLVDTYGLLHKGDLQRYLQMADEGLKPEIMLGYHAHNNFQLAYSNCIELLEHPLKRGMLVDGSLYGMGKSAGNAPIELLSRYMIDRCGKEYHVSQLLEAIDVTILDIYRRTPWGYGFKFYLSAANDCHPNYVTYLQEKRKLSVKSISEILDMISPEKKLLYDVHYIEKLYLQYQARECEDSQDRERLKELWVGAGKGAVLLLGPGKNIHAQKERVEACIKERTPVVIAVNFLPEGFSIDGLFISNAKRYVQLSTKLLRLSPKAMVIATSNVTSAGKPFDYVLNYSALLDEQAWIADNPLIMLIKLLEEFGVADIFLAGFDGFSEAETANYVNENMEHELTREKAISLNRDVENAIGRLEGKAELHFITDTLYRI